MTDTNISSTWNAGDLEFRQGEPGNASGTLLLNIDATLNGIGFQIGQASAAASNTSNFAANFSLHVTDNTGTTYYIPAKAATW